jgi:hypothetical protein
MEDYESIAQGLRIPVPKAALAKNDHISLSPGDASTVARLPNSPEYNVILRIMEGELEKLETEHMQSYKDRDSFDRSGLIAVAARLFYERFQVEVNFHSSEFIGNIEDERINKEVEQMSPEEFVRRAFDV